MAIRSTSQSCTIYQGWKYNQTGGSAGGNKFCTGTQSCTITWGWIGDGEAWQPNGSTNNSNATMSYGPDAEGYSGTLNRTSVSGIRTSPPTGAPNFGVTATTTSSGTANYSNTLTKADTRTYAWQTDGSQYNDAPSSVYYDDGVYAGWIGLSSTSGTPPTKSGSGTLGETATTSTSGTAYYSGDIPRKAPSTPGNFRVTSKNTESINVAWDAASNVDTYNIECYLANTSTWVVRDYSIPSSQLSKFITGLFSDTEFDIKLWATNTTGDSAATWLYDVKTEIATPLPAPTSVSISGITQTNATVSWGAVTGATSYSVEIYLQGTSTKVASDYNVAGTSKQFTTLTANTNYTAKVYGNKAGSTALATYENFATLPVAPPRPSNFSWTNPKVINSAYNLTESEWNGFLDKVNEFRVYKGFSAYSFNRAVVAGRLSYVQPTHTIFNLASGFINAMGATISSNSVSQRQVITANHLNGIVTSLNSIPSN